MERTVGDDLRDLDTRETAQIAAVPAAPPVPADSEPPTGAHGVDQIGALATLRRIPELAAVTWHLSFGTRNRIEGSLLIPAQPELRPMTPESARRELERFGSWLADGPATVRTATEGKRTRVIVDGVLHGVTVTLSALMPPPDPLGTVAPPTDAFEAVPEAQPVATQIRSNTSTPDDDQTGDSAA